MVAQNGSRAVGLHFFSSGLAFRVEMGFKFSNLTNCHFTHIILELHNCLYALSVL